MFENLKIKRRIRALKAQIADLEKKRARSQSALMAAIVEHKEASDEDVDYFNRYSTHIDLLRERIRTLQKQLEENKSKK